MFIKVIDGLRVLKSLEEEYNRVLSEYNERLRKVTEKQYRVELYKITKKVNGKLIVEYKGLKWISEDGEVVVDTIPPKLVAKKVIVPQKFPLIGFKIIIEGNNIKLKYRDYMKLSSILKDCEVVENPVVDINSFMADLKLYFEEYRRKLTEIGFREPQWMPVISTSIISRLERKYGVGREELIDTLYYLSDKGLVKVDYNGNELWISLKY
ncbi:MAG TPA: hypothetical protein EYH40_01170 [Desulfurococcales archaeon]|nr:hypothetical protein [Desulfurococcales archaeon]